MKRKMISLAAVLMAAGLTACGSAPNAGSTAAGSSVEETADTDSREDTSSTSVSEEPEAAQEDSTPAAGSSNILIVYFSVPEDIDTEGIDADAGASVVVRNGQVLGNLEYMAGKEVIFSGLRRWKPIRWITNRWWIRRRRSRMRMPVRRFPPILKIWISTIRFLSAIPTGGRICRSRCIPFSMNTIFQERRLFLSIPTTEAVFPTRLRQ